MMLANDTKKQCFERKKINDFESDDDSSSCELNEVSSDEESLEHDSIIAAKLRKVWKILCPPSTEENLVGKWFAVSYNQGKKQTLYSLTVTF